ncbi:MBL fold metallo-hydrolase [soil metagenome]
MRYGDLEIFPLRQGPFSVGTDKRFVPHREGDSPRPGTLFISVAPFLVRTSSEVLLLDCGLGEWAEDGSVDDLLHSMREHGVQREEVDRVLLSHLHVDHFGGAVFTAGHERRPTFPNAEFVVQADEITAPYSGSSQEARDEIIHVLERAGQLVTVSGSGSLTDEISYEHIGGHTRDHQAIRIHSGEMTVLFAGDVLATPGQVSKRFAAKYDYDGKASQEQRTRLVREAADGGHLILFYHSTKAAAGFAEETDKGAMAFVPAG